MSQKYLTVIIPTIGRTVLDQTIESVLNQSEMPDELLVWDNSGDGSARGSSKYSNDPRVRWEVSGERLPVIRSWNTAVDLAHGNYIYILGDDDFLLPEFISDVKKCLQKGVDLINVPVELMDMDGNLLNIKKKYVPERELSAAEYIKEYSDRKIDIYLGSLVFSKKQFCSIGKFKDIVSNAVAMDTLFNIEMAVKCGKIAVMGRPFWRYRTAVSDWCGRLKGKDEVLIFIEEMMKFRDCIRKYFTDDLAPLWDCYYRHWLISPLIGICYASSPSAAFKLLFRPGFSCAERLSILRDLFYCIRH